MRLRIVIRGAVQGVGFRPFVFRLAKQLGLVGWVNNSTQGVFIEAEGAPPALENLLVRLEAEKPPRSFIQSLEASWLDPVGYANFEIRASDPAGAKTALVLPDIATCPDCLREILDSGNRRYYYPFTNCTNCGPRFTIIESLPYDRANTSMKQFALCNQCRAEYDDPRDRRFHAQPNACPVCGPRIELWSPAGPAPASDGAAGGAAQVLAAAAQSIRQGRILALKGLGGFHLLAAAHDDAAVRRLRERKHREEKPLALMFPSLATIRSVCQVSPLEERLLCSPEAPIVLLRRHLTSDTASALSPSVAPGNPNLGVMLPYTPLHHLLLVLLGFPVVATSGNLSDEPICTDEHDALERLGGIADLFLVHNRPIVRHVDDSILRIMLGRQLVLRRARGYAPLPVPLPPVRSPGKQDAPKPALSSLPTVLAVGAHLKNAIALGVGQQAFVSQHIGDLETRQAYDAFCRVIGDFQNLYEAQPTLVAADAHPDYLSTRFAADLAARAASASGPTDAPTVRTIPEIGSRCADGFVEPLTGDVEVRAGAAVQDLLVLEPARSGGIGRVVVQHHLAHVLSCMAENELAPPVLGVSWDGTGYGPDGTVWGGEFFLVTGNACARVAHLRRFRLPGATRAIREPRRAALGLLFELFGEEAISRTDLAPVRAFSPGERASLKRMLIRGINSPLTSSAGRLFDAVAALTGLRQHVRFEGQAAMELEFALEGVVTEDRYPLPIAHEPPADAADLPSHPGCPSPAPLPPLLLDWSPLIERILSELEQGISAGTISAKFHNALAEAVVCVAKEVGQERVVLTGGCFQNRYLTERMVRRLVQEGFQAYWHQRVPPNDGGIALGQVMAARRISASPVIKTFLCS